MKGNYPDVSKHNRRVWVISVVCFCVYWLFTVMLT